MSIRIHPLEEIPQAVELRVAGTLCAADYLTASPELKRFFRQRGKTRLLAVMADFHALGFRAIWEDIKGEFDSSNDLERIALVGDRAWESWLTVVCKPFTNAVIRYFEPSEYQRARKWIGLDAAPESPTSASTRPTDVTPGLPRPLQPPPSTGNEVAMPE